MTPFSSTSTRLLSLRSALAWMSGSPAFNSLEEDGRGWEHDCPGQNSQLRQFPSIEPDALVAMPTHFNPGRDRHLPG